MRVPRRTFLVFCEGEKTEPDYLKALKRELGKQVSVSVEIQVDPGTHGSAPLTLVEAAAEARERADYELGEVDEVWCIFDVEQPVNHPKLNEAVALAQTSGVKVAISNPCFELWLLLHFQDQSAPLDTKPAQRALENLGGIDDKTIDGSKYMSLRDQATRRARLLVDRHKGNGTEFPNDNPSSGMFRFLEAVENLSED